MRQVSSLVVGNGRRSRQHPVLRINVGEIVAQPEGADPVVITDLVLDIEADLALLPKPRALDCRNRNGRSAIDRVEIVERWHSGDAVAEIGGGIRTQIVDPEESSMIEGAGIEARFKPGIDVEARNPVVGNGRGAVERMAVRLVGEWFATLVPHL